MTRQPVKTIVRAIIIGCVVVFILGYALYQARNLIIGPQIIIHSPVSGSNLATSFVEIDGTAKNVSFISLNNRQIFVNNIGNFKEGLLLAPGYNVWEFDAKDKFGRTVSKKIELIFNKS